MIGCSRNIPIIRTRRRQELSVGIGSDYIGLVRSPGLEPGCLRIRPSNVRVCQFHHDRLFILVYNDLQRFIFYHKYFVLAIGFLNLTAFLH